MSHHIGVVGLAVMGQNLALNIAEEGFSVAVFNRSPEKTDEFIASEEAQKFELTGYRELKAFVASLERPRVVLLMVKAGRDTDATIASLTPLLSPGDLIIDGGNAYYKDTERRYRELNGYGIHFFGMGVSGGEEGARHGPSLMPGGQREGYERMKHVLEKIAAQTDDGPCVTWIGPGSAGHYVKMVHNGIEYGDMQLISEAYDLLRRLGNFSNEALGNIFTRWNAPGSELESYLIEITGQIFQKVDPGSGAMLVDVIKDTASMKGTGIWTVQDALERGAPIPTIAAAVDARVISSQKDARMQAEAILPGPTPQATGAAALTDAQRQTLIEDVRHALFASKVMSYAQGLMLLKRASDTQQWALNLGEIARIWKAGCIIRSYYLLDRIKRAWQRNPELPNLLLDEEFASDIGGRQESWRRVVGLAVSQGVPVPAMSASLAWYDAIRCGRLPANLIQAQRDFFGAHTFERLDQPGTFHAEWGKQA